MLRTDLPSYREVIGYIVHTRPAFAAIKSPISPQIRISRVAVDFEMYPFARSLLHISNILRNFSK
jgi:hypothetical protein